MKTKLLFSLVIFLTVAAFIFEKQSGNVSNSMLSPPPANTDSEFLVNVMHSGIDINYDYYPQLGTNAWHIYCGPGGGWPGVSNDDIYHLPTEYGPSLLTKIALNRTHGFRSIMERPRTVHLAYSQRSEYQCESIVVGADYWFYAYDTNQTGNDTNDYEFNGNGARVRYCQTNPGNPGSNAGYVVKDLRSNREQSNKLWTLMHNDDTYEWYVMPRIRIDTSVLSINLNAKVCAIIMLDWNGDTIRSVDILASNFRDQNLHYNGNYIEEYNFTPLTNQLIIDPGVICPGFAKHFWDWTSDDDTNTIKTDFRVYWYGLCDMWIDYVRVENLPAHEFFNPLSRWDNEVRAEADFALIGYDADHPIPNNFYLEEFEFNMVPSIKHFNELVRDQTQNRVSLMVNLNYPLFKTHIPHSDDYEFSAAELQSYLVSRANLKYLVNMSYPLEGFEGGLDPGEGTSEHPNTLNDSDYSKTSGILSYKVSVSTYDDWLQQKLDIGRGAGDGFIKIMKKTDSISRYYTTDLNIVHLEQAHLIWRSSHKLKEPSNEEMSLMANLAITYGSKGIMYFAYNSDNQFTASYYQRGLTEPVTLLPRTSSVYGQNKWFGVQKIDSTLKKWGPYIMSFDNENRKSYILRLERDDLISETFFTDVITYKPFGSAPPCVEDDPGSNPSGMVYECKEDRYLQVATFQNNEPNTKYFMVVNRRCSPLLNDSTNNDNNGGRRFVRIMIDSVSSSFSGFNNWSVIDVSNDSLIKTFDKKTRADINLEWYLPGEGKLYKLAPVMQEGGTLVADEECGGDIECKGEVNNNGKNINLLPATTISFTNADARIIMDGGNFTSGYSFGNNSAPVHLKGKDNNYWKGLILQNCPKVEMLRTYFENISPYELDSTYAAEIVNCRYKNINDCSFRPKPDINAGGVRANFISGNTARLQVYILNSNFVMDAGNIPALSFIASGGITFPLIIENNVFTSGNGNSANAIFLTNINGGAVKDNNITGYRSGVFLLSSYMDFYNNVIDGSYNNSTGFEGYSQSNISMGTSGNYYTAGQNVISAEGANSKCVFVEKSFFDLHKGENIFDIKNYSSDQEYHLSGWFPNYQPNSIVSAVENCFIESGTNKDS